MKKLFLSLVLGIFLIGCGGGGGGDVNDVPSITDADIYSDDKGLKSLGVAEAPPLFISNEEPAPNESVNISVEGITGSVISLSATGSGCGTILNQSAISPLNITGNVGTNGYCDIIATYFDGSSQQSKAGRFVIAAVTPDLPPISSSKGTWIAGDLPKTSTTLDSDAKKAVGLPTIATIEGPRDFINGGSSEFTVHSSSGSNIAAILVQVDSYHGYFHIPVYTSGNSGQFKLSFAPDFFKQVRKTRAVVDLNLNVTIIDDLNQVSAASTIALNANETGFGDVKVSISWNTATDVDLHVTDPNGVRTSYGNDAPGNGSHLDLDSNAGCSIDGVNNENIFWDTGTAVPGEYTVTVDMWNACEASGANGTLTMIYNGEDSPKVVSWSLGSDGSKTFTFTHGGSEAKVSGKVTYEDFPITKQGLGASRMKPVRFAEVQVVRAFDKEILTTGSTDASGKYALSFKNDDVEHPGYYILVYARQNSETLKQEVKDFDREVYAFQSETTVNEIETPEKTDMDIAIKKADNAGAMNIFDVGVSCNNYARVHGGKVPEKLTFYWQVNGTSGSYYSSSSKHIVLLGKTTDPDEYDDLVIGHEYGHFVMDTYSEDDSPGGAHSLAPSTPTLAWSEGWATYFSAAALNKSFYLDTTGTGVGSYYSIESLPKSITLGNTDDALDGKISEAVVSAVLWDLHDNTNETFDTLGNKSTAIWKILTTYLKKGTKFKDRGKTGVDTVDFIDGWYCRGYGEKGIDAIGMFANVSIIHELSYDYKSLSSCK